MQVAVAGELGRWAANSTMLTVLAVTLPGEYIGRLLYLEPIDYSRWRHSDDANNSIEFAQAQTLGGCHIRVKYFSTLYRGNSWRAIVGKVEQPGHLLNGLWISCSVNYRGYFDFSGRLRKSWCRVGPERPAAPKFYIPSGFPFYEGAGVVAENELLIAKVLEAKTLDV